MGLFNKILHAGEGRKLKSLETIAPVVGTFEAEMQARSDDDLRALTARWREELDHAGDDDKMQEHLDDLLPEVVRRGAGGRRAHARPASLRRADHGRRGAALRLGRGDEDR